MIWMRILLGVFFFVGCMAIWEMWDRTWVSLLCILVVTTISFVNGLLTGRGK